MKLGLVIIGMMVSMSSFAVGSSMGPIKTVYKKASNGLVQKVSSASITTLNPDGSTSKANLTCTGSCSGNGCAPVGCLPQGTYECSAPGCTPEGGVVPHCTMSCAKAVSIIK